MSPVIVLVIFYSRSGSTEKLALAAAVGAVQARANIRLRRLPDADGANAKESPEDDDEFRRMRKEYVAPAERDIAAADAVIFVAPPDFNRSSAEWLACLDLLGKMGAEGRIENKTSVAIATTEPARLALSAAILRSGFIVAPSTSGATPDDADRARAHGRRIAAIARALKQNANPADAK
jgi:NAD(P)H dehydrogenase (quinone)